MKTNSSCTASHAATEENVEIEALLRWRLMAPRNQHEQLVPMSDAFSPLFAATLHTRLFPLLAGIQNRGRTLRAGPPDSANLSMLLCLQRKRFRDGANRAAIARHQSREF